MTEREAETYEAKIATLNAALRAITEIQPRTLKALRDAGVVFDEMPHAPVAGEWQQIAFSIYTDLCEVDMIARAALAEDCAKIEGLEAAARAVVENYTLTGGGASEVDALRDTLAEEEF